MGGNWGDTGVFFSSSGSVHSLSWYLLSAANYFRKIPFCMSLNVSTGCHV